MGALNGLETIVYWSRDVQEAGRWYRTVLGIEPNYDTPYYVGFTIAGDEFGLHPIEGAAAAASTEPAQIAYWSTADVKAEVARWIEHGATEHKAPHDVGGGIVLGSVRDPFGNVIGLIQNPKSPNRAAPTAAP